MACRYRSHRGAAAAPRRAAVPALWLSHTFSACRCARVGTGRSDSRCASPPKCRVPLWSHARTLASLYCSSWLDLVLADGQRFGSQSPCLDLVLANEQRFRSQPWIDPRYRFCAAADGVIPQLEPLTCDFNELASVVGPEPADIIKAAGKHLMAEIEAATNHLVGHQHHFVVIDDLPVAMTLYA